MSISQNILVPFFRFDSDPDALSGIEESLRSGWLTTGPKTKQFETEFARALGNENLHAIALNSCTAALHLSLEAIGLSRGDRVIVPTMTFAATAEVVRYFDAVPVMCDVDSGTMCISPVTLRNSFVKGEREKVKGRIAAVIPVHYGGQPCDMHGITEVAHEFGAEVIEDAAHAFPAGWMREEGTGKREGQSDESGDGDSPLSALGSSLKMVGNNTSRITCFSFYANKTITTGEGGMAVTADAELAARMRLMSLHGMNRDAWKRFSADGSWDYQIVAPGFKYNMTDIAAALGLSQLKRAEEFRLKRAAIVERYNDAFRDIDEIELLQRLPDVLHSEHLYVIKLRLDQLSFDRAEFIERMKAKGVMCSVHWRPLHMHPYYVETYGYRPEDFPVAAELWERIVSLPVFPGMREEEIEYVVATVLEVVKGER
ncbi:MAG: DegT/DnrJ/EryC1/StrS family aminotransferase [Bacteroidota bacterium]